MLLVPTLGAEKTSRRAAAAQEARTRVPSWGGQWACTHTATHCAVFEQAQGAFCGAACEVGDGCIAIRPVPGKARACSRAAATRESPMRPCRSLYRHIGFAATCQACSMHGRWATAPMQRRRRGARADTDPATCRARARAGWGASHGDAASAWERRWLGRGVGEKHECKDDRSRLVHACLA